MKLSLHGLPRTNRRCRLIGLALGLLGLYSQIFVMILDKQRTISFPSLSLQIQQADRALGIELFYSNRSITDHDNSTETRHEYINEVTYRPDYQQSTKIPQWMKDYFDWHRDAIKKINESNFEQWRYLILRCSKRDRKCGGVADRLKSIPFHIAAAAKSKRIFLIRWERPTPLEDFLVPNEINWSVPIFMSQGITKRTISTIEPSITNSSAKFIVHAVETYPNVIIVESKIQDFYGASSWYNKIEPSLDNDIPFNSKAAERLKDKAGWDRYELFFHDLFRAMFAPSTPVKKLIEERILIGNLSPGNYVGCHHRAFYAIEHSKHVMKKEELQEQALNAVRCASTLLPGKPIYFASDSQVSTDAVREYSRENNLAIVTVHEENEEALHLDKATGHATAFYSTFVDLLLMADSKCMAHGTGGFGRFAALLGHNVSCTMDHTKHRNAHCAWTDNTW